MIYHHIIPYQGEQLGRFKLPTLRIEGQAPLRCEFILKEFSAELDENVALTRDLDLDEGVTSSSSSFMLFDFSNSKEEGEEVNQLVRIRR